MNKMSEKFQPKGGSEMMLLLSKLIGFQTTENFPDQKQKCLEFLEQHFGKTLMVRRFLYRGRPMMVFSNTKQKKVDVILAGHIDVVPATAKDFVIKEAGRRMYGRGMIDMKAAMLACLLAASEYVTAGGKATIAVVVTSDEEMDGLSTKWLAEKVGYKAKLAILPDGGNENELVLRQKGFWQIKVMIRGKSAHASRPWEGESPIEKGQALYAHLLSRFPRPKNQYKWQTSVVLTKLVAGEALNQIPDEATFYFDIRYVAETDKQQLAREIRLFLSKSCVVETVAENGALIVDTQNQQVLQLKAAIEKVLGKKVTFMSECGTSDAIFFAEQGTPAILFRPKGDGMHQAVEWVDKKSLLNFQAVILEYLRGL